MLKNTKVQSISGSLLTTIPAFARDMLSVEKGDVLTWDIDTKTETITISKKE